MNMGRVRMTLACWDYDRTRALGDGRVQVDGVDLNYLSLPVEETFFRMLRFQEFEAAEMSLSSYLVSLHRAERHFVAIPVFPSRFFRHSCIFVSRRSNITRPQELAGRKIGVPEYQMTAPVWIRGILADEFGVDPASMQYLTGGEEQPGREEKLKLNLPARFRVQPIGPAQTLSAMLAAGEIDALFSARTPSTFRTRPDDVQRLFPDFVSVEKAYFAKTGVFPIMHVIAIRRDFYEANRWVARSLYKAFAAAQQYAYEDLVETAAYKTMLPWQIAALEDTVQTLGPRWWPYGLADNRSVIETFIRYHHEQGLSDHRLAPEELFAPESLQEFRI
jgi:4,5-dihydroxyphthalate decarboxylase